MLLATVMKEAHADYSDARRLLLRHGAVKPTDKFDRREVEWLLQNYSEWSGMRRLIKRTFVGVGIQI
jgi:hypothetical protein